MKKTRILMFCVGFLVLSMIPAQVFGGIALTDNFNFYGFIKLDGHYHDGNMNSFLAPRYATGGDGGSLLFSALNSRFGFKWNVAELCKGWKIGAQLEWDLFDPSTPNQMKFRTRHANFTLSRRATTLLFGQFWDLFAPLGPTTLMTNGYLWQVGNVGFRRAQMRWTFASKKFNVAGSLNDPTSNEGRASKTPLLEGRIGVKPGANIEVGFSAAYGKEKFVVPYAVNVDIIGMCLDWNIRIFGPFTIKGEYTRGENLKNFLSRAYIFDDGTTLLGKKVNSVWGQVVYNCEKCRCIFWAGYSFEKFTSNTQMVNGELEQDSCMMAGIKCNLCKEIAVGLEYANFVSKYFQVANNDKTNQFILSFIYGF